MWLNFKKWLICKLGGVPMAEYQHNLGILQLQLLRLERAYLDVIERLKFAQAPKLEEVKQEEISNPQPIRSTRDPWTKRRVSLEELDRQRAAELGKKLPFQPIRPFKSSSQELDNAS
jgi:hypothetical protein